MPRERIACVILAAGLSSRMGKNKLLVELNGKSVVCRAVETARAAELIPIFVVVGHEREKIEAELKDLNCTPVFNKDYATGMNSSLRAGIAAVPDDFDGALVMLADMPLVRAPMLRALVETFRSSEAPLVISTYEGILAPPVIYSRALFGEITEPEGDGNGKRIIQRHRAEAAELRWPALALTDLDLPADVERVRAHLEEK